MSSWHPDDLVRDQDLVDYESDILTNFGATSWMPRRTKACEDWLFPILSSRGFDPLTLRTRYDPTVVWGYTASAYTDLSDAAKSTTVDDIDLAAIFATPGTDALYVGSVEPFRGVFLRMDDAPSAVTGTLTVAYWSGVWTTLLADDETVWATGAPFSGGGSIRWSLPPGWTSRVINDSDRLYWARLTVSATPTSATAGQLATIRSSQLRAAVAFRTLYLIMREAPTGQEGPWGEKAEAYKDDADTALARALDLIGGEFDTDESGQVSETEAAQTAAEAGGGGRVLERA